MRLLSSGLFASSLIDLASEFLIEL